jgi:hypothetical protein
MALKKNPKLQRGLAPFPSFPQSLLIHFDIALCDICTVRPSEVFLPFMLIVADSGLSR